MSVISLLPRAPTKNRRLAETQLAVVARKDPFSQNQHEITCTVKQIAVAGRSEVFISVSTRFQEQTLPMFNAGKSQNAASEQNCNVYWSKVSIQPIPKLMCVIYSTVVPLNACPCGLVWLPCFALLRFAGVPLLCCFVLLPSFLLCLATVQILDLNWFAALS